MQVYRDNYQIDDENSAFELSILSVLGDRTEQQDSAGYELKNSEGIVVVCDGMGGHAGGKLASTIAVESLLNEYTESYPCEDTKNMLLDSVKKIDTRISSLKNDTGEPMRAGSTMVAVIVKDNLLRWVSVGDSRIYIYRNEELVQVTHDHTYQSVLDEKLLLSQITEDEYKMNSQKGEALVSFLGVGGLPKIDLNENPFVLKKADRIILMSDGLYRVLSDSDLNRILNNFGNISDSLSALEMKVKKVVKNNSTVRDNMTIAMLKIK